MTWLYKNKEINSHDDLLPECTSIVYCLYYESGKKYVGKLVVRSMRRLKPTKEQIKIRKNYKRVELKDIPFKHYTGSSKETEGQTLVFKEILYQCSTKKAATYIEAGILFNENAIFDDEYLNKNILGSFFDSDLNGLLDCNEKEDEESDTSKLAYLESENSRLMNEVDTLSRLVFPDSTGR